MRHVLILGATSAIAQETSKCFAEAGDAIFLVARSAERLNEISADLRVRGAAVVDSYVVDLNDLSKHALIIEKATASLKQLDTAVIAFGTLGNQSECEADFAKAQVELHTNFVSPVSLLTQLSNLFAQQKHGSIAVISSVAGDRGRMSNYVYGSAKGGLNVFLSGLRNRLFHVGVHVLTVKPGFVDTPMTAQFKKGPLFVKADVVGRGIFRAICQRKNTAYLPWFWQYIMLVIRHIPEVIFKRLSL